MSANRLKWMIFFIVFLFVSAIYFKTTAPTTAFWDVGEFLAASHILGVPHPPGTPFYVLLAKFFDLLPIPVAELYSLINGGIKANPVVLKMTLIPILMGGLNAALVYLISYEVLKLIKGDEVLPDWALHLFSATGALTMAFARIVWFDSIEVETYTPGAFFGILALYFGLLWYKNRENDNSLKWLIWRFIQLCSVPGSTLPSSSPSLHYFSSSGRLSLRSFGIRSLWGFSEPCFPYFS
jgi:hypothetical protein